MENATASYEDKRAQGKTLEEDARGVLARVANTPNANVYDLGGEALPLREDDSRSAMIAAVRGEAAKLAGLTVPDNPERQLSPEDAERTLATLKTRFDANGHLHKGLDWSKVKAALEANPEALWSINQMEAEGHEPDVYNVDDNGFEIGTCSVETPSGTRNCVYDAQAAAWLQENSPEETFNGSAVEMAEAMGISLMSPIQYHGVLQSKGAFDRQTQTWILTHESDRRRGSVLHGASDSDVYDIELYWTDPKNYDDERGWRGSLGVLWT